ncbi:hypothetical protein LTR17_025544 [Elasticomyces elasticus]|nr:hypothetical protein LTR17_025544 [Elasticomyces elasticus]
MVSLPGPTLDPVLPTATHLADQMAHEFLNAVHALTNVTTFTYTPAYEEDAGWGKRWRHIQFHSGGLSGNGNDEYDAACDALQLFVALCAVSSAPNCLPSINLYTKGYAFWGLPYLHHLLHWPKRLEDRGNMLFGGSSFYDEGFNGDDLCLSIYTEQTGGTLAFMQRTEALTRQLVTWKHHYSRLARLECRVDTLWLERPGSSLTAATELSNGLKLATGLEELSLVFRADAIADELGGFLNYGDLHKTQVPNQASMFESAQVSQRLLTLLPDEGQWETMLQAIAQQLRLESIGLESLEDICSTGPRLILHLEAPVWTAASKLGYSQYKDAIVDFTLRRSWLFPPLSPEEFLRDGKAA